MKRFLAIYLMILVCSFLSFSLYLLDFNIIQWDKEIRKDFILYCIWTNLLISVIINGLYIIFKDANK